MVVESSAGRRHHRGQRGGGAHADRARARHRPGLGGTHPVLDATGEDLAEAP
ncbi:MAG: hypothetical protein AVDCRST_MAG79-1945 [uncultured Thermoleophilia bacterium]|uniref:Uncharacterized protein n=1 Tax=uncultured Thermoleophilia bacterium TaxID=1497501 RepID=A0A6J4U917_9ACTN|nr:MAG: hypothetical protein AVDCRST_MAG79-1945 [uncultured Thermoleophilia bacterium]